MRLPSLAASVSRASKLAMLGIGSPVRLAKVLLGRRRETGTGPEISFGSRLANAASSVRRSRSLADGVATPGRRGSTAGRGRSTRAVGKDGASEATCDDVPVLLELPAASATA